MTLSVLHPRATCLSWAPTRRRCSNTTVSLHFSVGKPFYPREHIARAVHVWYFCFLSIPPCRVHARQSRQCCAALALMQYSHPRPRPSTRMPHARACARARGRDRGRARARVTPAPPPPPAPAPTRPHSHPHQCLCLRSLARLHLLRATHVQPPRLASSRTAHAGLRDPRSRLRSRLRLLLFTPRYVCCHVRASCL